MTRKKPQTDYYKTVGLTKTVMCRMPETTWELLSKRADKEHRSMQMELLKIAEKALGVQS